MGAENEAVTLTGALVAPDTSLVELARQIREAHEQYEGSLRASLEAFGVYEVTARVGDEWIATSRAGRLVERVRIAPDTRQITLR